MTFYYSPHTCEHIATKEPADWMGVTSVAPPVFDPATAGCFWRGIAWAIVVATPDPKPAILAQIVELEASITPRRLRDVLLSGDTTFIKQIESQLAVLRGQLK